MSQHITPNLFDRLDRPGRSRAGAPRTSRHAAVRNAPGRMTQAQRVHRYIRDAGGATIEEAALALGLRQSSAAARGTDLRRLGLLIDTGDRRETTSGAYAIVWRAVDVEGAGE